MTWVEVHKTASPQALSRVVSWNGNEWPRYRFLATRGPESFVLSVGVRFVLSVGVQRQQDVGGSRGTEGVWHSETRLPSDLLDAYFRFVCWVRSEWGADVTTLPESVFQTNEVRSGSENQIALDMTVRQAMSDGQALGCYYTEDGHQRGPRHAEWYASEYRAASVIDRLSEDDRDFRNEIMWSYPVQEQMTIQATLTEVIVEAIQELRRR